GLLTTYEPLRPVVRRGQQVRPGQLLGRLLLRGGHCAPAACLHWGLRRGLVYLDPLGLVGAGRVRLLPLDGAPAGDPLAASGLAASGAVALALGGRRLSRAGR